MKGLVYEGHTMGKRSRKGRPLSHAMQKRAESIWKALSSHVTIERDAILKDPDWPHLWDHKR